MNPTCDQKVERSSLVPSNILDVKGVMAIPGSITITPNLGSNINKKKEKYRYTQKTFINVLNGKLLIRSEDESISFILKLSGPQLCLYRF